ncbi:MAG TPA: DUF1127 domain-containing protein [Bauldia sp.]|nr:DUF1127 domain-containing protein [Bauldia sp.]
MVTTELGARPAGAGEKLQHFIEAAFTHAVQMWRAARNRRAVAKLLEWDDRSLRDIGLTVSDVRGAMAGRLGEDPSSRLASLSSERRQGIRAAAIENLKEVRTRQTKLPVHSVPFPDL